MSGRLAMSEIVDGALQGIQEAQRVYEEWSGGWWLGEAPEYMATVFVAKAIAELDGAKYVTLEHGAKAAMKEAGATGKGKLPSKAAGRFDILLWWANDKPRAPIEVKCQVAGIEKIKGDLLAIEKILQRKKDDSSFQFGLVVFYSSTRDRKDFSATEILERQLEKIEADCRRTVTRCAVGMTSSEIHKDDNSAWAATVILLKPQ